MHRAAFALLVGVALLSPVGEAEACSLPPGTYREGVDTSSVSAEVPAPTMASFEVERGCGDDGGHGDCASFGSLIVVLEPIEGVDLDAHGLLFEVQSGEVPGIGFPSTSWKIENGRADIKFGDGYGQPAFEGVVALRLVDDRGWVGAASAPVTIADPGGSSCAGCTCAGRPRGTVSWAVALGIAGLLGVRRRRS